MSVAFAARYYITVVEDLGSGIFRVTGDVYDYSFQSYSASDAQVGDIIVDEDAWDGSTDRWEITEIVSVSGTQLVCKVTWDDEGTADPNGPAPSDAAIARFSTNLRLAEVPTVNYTGVSENIQIKLLNINQRHNIDPQGVSGYSGFSGYSGIGISGYSGIEGISGYSGSEGISGYSGIEGLSGYSGISGISGYSGVSGYYGVDGASGYSGISGYSGVSGYYGVDGASGYSGISGYFGISGYSGLQGISGYSGTSAPQYIHTQSVSATTWNVNHNLNQRYVNVEVIDAYDYHAIRPLEVIYTDENNLQITLTESLTGIASIVGGSAGTWGQSEVQSKNTGYTILTSDFNKVFICDSTSDQTFYLPSVDTQHIGKWLRIIKLGSGKVTVQAADSDKINQSSAGGTIDCDASGFSTATLQLITSTDWISISETGASWTVN